MDFVKNLNLSNLTQSEIETISNYILYGKDEDDKSCVDKKEIEIQTKFNSYNKNKNNVVSLDELLESPTFDESIIVKGKSIYKKSKPTIDRKKAAKVPGMIELWNEIERWQRIYDENSGKIEKTEDTPVLNQRQLYFLKHHLIQLRTQQYYLMDSAYPTMPSIKNKAEYWENLTNSQGNYPILPRGVMREERDLSFTNPRKNRSFQFKVITEEEIQKLEEEQKEYFDFTNPDHVYQLIQYYEEIENFIERQPESILHNLLWTLDFYIEKANLSEQQKLIVNGKKRRKPNRDIAKALKEKLNIYHQENYISTIWNKTVQLICDAAALNFDEWLCRNYDKAWKKCNCCGKELLRDPRNFVRKAKASDGLTGRCKVCDARLRLEKKMAKQGEKK